MEEFYFITFALIALAVLLIAPIFFARIKSKLESGKELVFQTFASVSFGLFNSNIPSTRITVYKEFLVFSNFRLKVINYSEILDLELSKNLLSNTLVIELNSGFPIKVSSNKAEAILRFILP